MNPNELQVGGGHYKSEFQHWDFVVECLQGRYLEGCVTKYVARWRKKNGLQDLQKSLHYLDKIIHLYGDQGILSPMYPVNAVAEFQFPLRVLEFCEANGLNDMESLVMCHMATWADLKALHVTRKCIESLIAEASTRVELVVTQTSTSVAAVEIIKRDPHASLLQLEGPHD